MKNRYGKRMRRGKENSPVKKACGFISNLLVIPVTIWLILKGFVVTVEQVKCFFGLLTGTAAGVCVLRVFMAWYRKKKYLSSDMYRIDNMSGIEFEEFLKCFFKEKGYRVKMTPGSGDYGVDLICTRGNSKGKEKEKVAVQAKRYRSVVGIAAIQQVIGGMHYYNCNKAVVITNSSFTQNARKLAAKSGVELMDRAVLKKELKRLNLHRGAR